MSAPADGGRALMREHPAAAQTSPQSPQPQESPQLPQSPHSPRDRRRRGHSPLTVLIDPPSMDDAAADVATSAATASLASGAGSDSLSLALEELRTGGCRPSANFFEAHERVNGADSGSRSDDDFLAVRPAAKRSSSLRSKKTPPGTPNQVKKAVRFADAFGLDLANVKHVLDPDNPPEIPPQATSDLDLGGVDGDDDDDNDDSGNEGDGPRSLPPPSATAPQVCMVARPAFSQPGQSAGFGARVMAQKVVLESAAYFAQAAEIRGCIRVANLAFDKSVSLRVTFDGWRSSVEVAAAYVPNSSSGMTDQFAFSLAVPAQSLQQPGAARIAFCIAYSVCGQAFWDNNFGENYAFDCAVVAANW